MNLDELQSVQARERQSSDLQHLRSSFYAEVGEFIESLQAERARVVEEADDPFSSPEVRRLTDDIETAEATVEAIYERRVGKVVKKASIAAADMPVDDDGLTAEEERLFEDLVARIEQNREAVLSVLDGNAPNVSCSITDEGAPSDPSTVDDEPPAAAGEPAIDDTTAIDDTATAAGSAAEASSAEGSPGNTEADRGVSAADLMGSGTETETDATGNSAEALDQPVETPEPPEPDGASPEDGVDRAAQRTAVPPASGPPGAADPTNDATDLPRDASDPSNDTTDQASETADEPSGGREVPGVPRTTVRITSDVGEIVGADNRDYELGAEDVVTLPEPNADVLVRKNAAERL